MRESDRMALASALGIDPAIIGNIAILCPNPAHDDQHPSFSLHTEKMVGLCFSCGFTAGPYTLAGMFGVHLSDEPDTGAFLPTEIDRILSEQLNRGRARYLPEVFLDRFKFPTDYWKERGFSQSTIELFQLGYDPLMDAGTIPIRDSAGRLLGVTKRLLNPYPDDPRYKDPKGFLKSENLFGSWLCNSNIAVMVEGPTDVIAVRQAGYNGLGQYGRILTQRQIRLLKRLGITHLILAYDNDPVGRDLTNKVLGRARGKEYDASIDLTKAFVCASIGWTKGAGKDAAATPTPYLAKMLASVDFATV